MSQSYLSFATSILMQPSMKWNLTACANTFSCVWHNMLVKKQFYSGKTEHEGSNDDHHAYSKGFSALEICKQLQEENILISRYNPIVKFQEHWTITDLPRRQWQRKITPMKSLIEGALCMNDEITSRGLKHLLSAQ